MVVVKFTILPVVIQHEISSLVYELIVYVYWCELNIVLKKKVPLLKDPTFVVFIDEFQSLFGVILILLLAAFSIVNKMSSTKT